MFKPAIPVVVAMDEKWEERRAHKDAVVSPSLICPWPGKKLRYNPNFNLGMEAEWMMGTAESVDTSVDKDADMKSLLDCGFELDFLESIDMSDFDCDNDQTCEESGSDRGLDIKMLP